MSGMSNKMKKGLCSAFGSIVFREELKKTDDPIKRQELILDFSSTLEIIKEVFPDDEDEDPYSREEKQLPIKEE